MFINTKSLIISKTRIKESFTYLFYNVLIYIMIFFVPSFANFRKGGQQNIDNNYLLSDSRVNQWTKCVEIITGVKDTDYDPIYIGDYPCAFIQLNELPQGPCEYAIFVGHQLVSIDCCDSCIDATSQLTGLKPEIEDMMLQWVPMDVNVELRCISVNNTVDT